MRVCVSECVCVYTYVHTYIRTYTRYKYISNVLYTVHNVETQYVLIFGYKI